jgi:predicted nicotinamide N-methyase
VQEPLMAGYRVKQESVPVTGVDDLLIRALRDRQQFHDPTGLAAALGISSAAWPLFGLLWPSASQLAAHMGARALQPGERILELGCGLALPSLVSHRRGADVTASDRHPMTQRFLQKNLRLNGLPPMAYRHGDWSLPALESAAPGPSGDLEVQGRFGLLIGSDLLYERDDGGTLPAYIECHALPRAEVLIVDPDRGNRSAFNRRMQAMGFDLSESRLDRPADGVRAAYKGRLLQYRRSRGTAATMQGSELDPA